MLRGVCVKKSETLGRKGDKLEVQSSWEGPWAVNPEMVISSGFFVFLFAFAKFPAAGWRTLGSVGTENGDQLEAETAGIGACGNKSGHAVSLATEHRFSQRWDQGF